MKRFWILGALLLGAPLHAQIAPPDEPPIFPAPVATTAPDLPPDVAPTPNPTPSPTPPENPLPVATALPESLPAPTETAAPIPEEITGQEADGGSYTLDAPSGVVYDMERGLALAQRDVTFRYREFTVKGDRGLVDYNTNKATLAGNLTVTARGQTFTGKTLVFDLVTGNWRLSQLETTFPPDLFPPGQVLEPIYLLGGDVTGQNDEVKGENFTVSSCDRGHYYLRSKRLEFVRDSSGQTQKLVLRKNGLYVFGRRILPLPVFVLNLQGQSSRLPLQVSAGQNASDGFFVRTLYNLRDDGRRSDSVLVDALQKRGLGLGLQREFLSGGLLYLYALSGQTGGRQIDARIDKTYRFAEIYSFNTRFDSTQNNEVSGENSGSSNADFTLQRNGARAQSQMILGLDETTFSGFENRAARLSLEHRQDFGQGLGLTGRSDYNVAEFGGGASKTLDNDLQFSRSAKNFDLFLRAETHDDLVQNKSSSLERLPELTLQSGSERLKLPVLSDYLPGDFAVSYGVFNEPSFDTASDLGGRKSRTNFLYNARQKSWRLAGNGKSKLFFDAGGNFEQAFYSDDTARYNYAFSQGLRGEWGNLRSQINYAKQRTYGYTPFQFDFFTPGETVDATLSYDVRETFRFNLTTGRDIQNGISRDVIGRVQWSPSKAFYASVGTSYQQENGNFGDIYGNFRFNSRRDRLFGGAYALGLRYSPDGRGLTRANASADFQISKDLRFQALAGYDGGAKRFDFTQFRFTQDLHCFNLFATYDGQRKEIRFDLALKAFPFTDTRFGRNEFSEGFDAGVGDVR